MARPRKDGAPEVAATRGDAGGPYRPPVYPARTPRAGSGRYRSTAYILAAAKSFDAYFAHACFELGRGGLDTRRRAALDKKLARLSANATALRQVLNRFDEAVPSGGRDRRDRR
jgi:hypothetical protein